MIIVGVSGASGSGKSLLSNTIKKDLDSERVMVLSEDRYYKCNLNKTMEERNKINYDHPTSMDHKLLKEHLKCLKNKKKIAVPTYDYSTHTRDHNKTIEIEANLSILVIEGILIFTDKDLRDLMDIKIYMDTPLDKSLIRRLKRDTKERGRDIDSVLNQYQETVRPMFLQFIEPSKRYADLIVPHGGKNSIAIDLIRAKLNELLTKSY